MQPAVRSALSASVSAGCAEFWRERGEDPGITFGDIVRAGAAEGKRKKRTSRAVLLADRIARELEQGWKDEKGDF